MNVIVIYDENETDKNHKIYSVIQADYIGDFAIRVFFSDGHQKLVDFKPFLEQSKHPDIRQYLDEEKFQEFEIVEGNLDWNNYELIFPVADLYHNSILKKPQIEIDESLSKYLNKPLFQEKVDKANEILARTKLPEHEKS